MNNTCRLKLEWIPEAYKENEDTSSKSISASQKLVKPLVGEKHSLKINKGKYKR
ncbi:hypothetical protein FHW89_003988 [Mucilaginibacter sp. SG564]|nr:hypothetical protein [Mucilaginibacter sp. SG564]